MYKYMQKYHSKQYTNNKRGVVTRKHANKIEMNYKFKYIR